MKIAHSVDPFGAADMPDGNPPGPERLAAHGAPNAPVTDQMVEYQPPQWDPDESDKPPSPPGGNASGKDPYSDEKYNSGLDSYKPVFSANQLKANLGKFHSADGAAGQAGQIGVELPSQGLRPPLTRLPDSSDLGETPGGFGDSLTGGSGIGPDPGPTDPAGFTPDPAGPDGRLPGHPQAARRSQGCGPAAVEPGRNAEAGRSKTAHPARYRPAPPIRSAFQRPHPGSGTRALPARSR